MARKNLILSTIGVALLLFLSQVEGIVGDFRAEELLENGFSANLIFSALESDWMTLVLPILCAIPCTASLVEEIKSGFVKEYLPRTTIDYMPIDTFDIASKNRSIWAHLISLCLIVLIIAVLAIYKKTKYINSRKESK